MMRVLFYLFIIFTFTFQGCDLLSPSDDKPIRVEIYEDGCGYEPVQVIHMDAERSILINPDTLQGYAADYYNVYAFQNGYYTQLYNCEYGDTINITFDPAPQDMLSGVAFEKRYNHPDRPLEESEMVISDNSGIVARLVTDAQGRYSADIGHGVYHFSFPNDDSSPEPPTYWYYKERNYVDFHIISGTIPDEKPNIYIYPENETNLIVSLQLPKGSYMTKSIPGYGDGWSVRVTPDGIIDGEYEYLFYECETKPFFQTQKGWICKKENLTDFFKKDLIQTGFEGREIDDFIKYWIPKLDKYPYYTIYPQYNNILDKHIPLEISEKPDNILRLHYVIRGMNHDNIAIVEPNIPVFNRSGFVVTEWGVIRLN